MEKTTKIIRGIPVSVERKSTTDIEITINNVPITLQTHRVNTYFELIERCFLEEAIKQGSLL